MSEEFTDKRFGVVAIEKGFISMDQLLEGLEIQLKGSAVDSGKDSVVRVKVVLVD